MATVPYYTYMHTRNDTGRPFYIGKGTGHRAWDDRPHKRGSHWTNVVKKCGHRVHILARWGTEEEANQHEILLIAAMRDMGVPLVNKTNGGEGTSGYKWRPESLARLSASKTGTAAGSKNPMYGRSHSPDARAKQSAAKAGRFVGSKHPRATIDEQMAANIKSLKGSVTAKQVSQQLGVSFHVVRNIWGDKSWGHVNG